MAAFIFNIAKGRAGRLAQLPETSDELLAVLLSASEAQATLEDYDDLAALLAAVGNTEATFTGYSRKALTNVVVTIDDAGDRVTIDCDDVSWSPTTAESLTSILLCYDPDNTVGTDADIIPLFHDDFVLTTPTSDVVNYVVNADGFYAAS